MWNVVSYNGFSLASSSYQAYLEDSDNPSILPTVQVGAIGRGEYAPVLSGIERKPDQLVITVKIKASDWYTAHKNLVGAFSNINDGTAALVLRDPTGVQWYVLCRPLQVLRINDPHVHGVKIPMLVPDRIWRKAASAVAWNISATPATQAIANAGNQKTYPVFTFKPTAGKDGGFLYRQWIPIYNPGDKVFDNWGLDLTDGGLDTRGWVADAAVSNQCNGAVTGGATSITIDTPVGGGLTSRGMGYLDDGTNQSQIAWTGMTGTPTSGTLTGVTWSVGGTTSHNFADNTVIKLSYMQASGADLRFYSDGIERDLWPVRMNQATSQLWARWSGGGRGELTLRTAIAGSGTIETIEFAKTTANKDMLNKLPTSGTLLIGTEAFKYDGKSATKVSVDVLLREANDTTAGAHSIGDTARFIEHDCWLYSGSSTLTARVNDDTLQPMCDIETSTNDSRVYTQFGTLLGLRANEWRRAVTASSNTVYNASETYAGNHQNNTADPYTDMGMRMRAVYKSAKWYAENGKIEWSIYDPAGIVTVDWDLEVYRVGSSFPAVAKLRKSKNGTTYEDQVAATSPTVVSTWQAQTPAVQNLGSGYYYVKTAFEGTIAAGGGSGGVNPYEANLETDSVTYTTSAPPVVSIYPRSASTYELEATVKNATNDMEITVKKSMKLNTELVVDCGAKTAIYSVDGLEYRTAIFVDESQLDWMVYEVGNNDLEYTESGVAGLLLTCNHDDLLVV